MKSNHLNDIFYQLFNQTPILSVRAPGRVNLIGEHIDYNDGPVLPMAINQEVIIIARPTGTNVSNIFALDFDQNTSFQIDEISQKIDTNQNPLPNWAKYPAGVAWALQEEGYQPSGINVLYTSNIPIGAGLSSSAAVEVGFATLWNELDRWQIDPFTLAKISQKAENLYIGVSCGLMDQFASACGVAGHALYFDTRSHEYEIAPLPDSTAIVVVDSRVPRSLTDSAYNERRASCEQAVKVLQKYNPQINSLRDIEPTEFKAYQPYLPFEAGKRAEHVVKEIARVESAYRALKRDDREIFGALMYSSHASLRDLYEVSTPELDRLVELARQASGCYGARLTGAGFGGCTVNLVNINNLNEFIEHVSYGYRQSTNLECIIYVCNASQGATATDIQITGSSQ